MATSPLHAAHEKLGATFTDFGGWNMPVSYSGTVAEHAAVRESVGIFDVSHLGKARVSGTGAAELVNSTLTNDLGRIGPGKAQYTLCCNESGGVVDDLIAYLRGDDDVFLIPNAANTATVVEMLREAAPEGVEVTDLHEDYVVLAVQGPQSDEVLTSMGLPVDHDYMSFDTARWQEQEIIVCRTGYTGELGYEIFCHPKDGAEVFAAVAEAGAPSFPSRVRFTFSRSSVKSISVSRASARRAAMSTVATAASSRAGPTSNSRGSCREISPTERRDMPVRSRSRPVCR